MDTKNTILLWAISPRQHPESRNSFTLETKPTSKPGMYYKNFKVGKHVHRYKVHPVLNQPWLPQRGSLKTLLQINGSIFFFVFLVLINQLEPLFELSLPYLAWVREKKLKFGQSTEILATMSYEPMHAIMRHVFMNHVHITGILI